MKNGDSFYYDEEVYRKPLDREDTLERLFRIAAYHYSKGEWHEFEYSLKIIIPFLPKGIRERFIPLVHDITNEGIEDHYQQFLKIQEMIESDTNMIWKKRYIKTHR